jgi:hypothetical protein
VTGPVTLTFTSDAFVGTSLTVTPSFFPLNVEINASGITDGTFFEGEFFATSNSGVTSVDKDALTAHLASFSTVISASGYISVNSSFTSATSSDIVLRARDFVNVTASQIIRTHGGDIVLWADSDQSAGGVVRLLGGATLCTAPAGEICGASSTGGGDIVIGGGAADPGNSSRPGGYAIGSGSTYNLTGTSNTSGVQLGTLGVASTGAKLFSAGGDITVRGEMASNPGNNRAAGVYLVGGAEIRSGQGKIFVSARAMTVGGTNTDGTMVLNSYGGGLTIESLNNASDAIVLEGIDNSNARTSAGIWGSNDNSTVSSAGGFVLRADHIDASLDLDFSVSGQVVLEPYTSLLRDSETGTSWTADIVNASDVSGDRLRLVTSTSGIRIGSASNSNQVILNTSFSSAADIEVIAGQIDVSNNPQIINTGVNSKIEFKATGGIFLNDGSNSSDRPLLQTNNGDLVLWADSDGNGSGVVYVGGFAELNSANGRTGDALQGGGRITIAGSFGNSGVDADGHPLGAATNQGTNSYALVVQGSSEIISGGGKVTIRGYSDSGVDTFHNNIGSLIDSGTGQISISVSHLARAGYVNQGGTLKSASTISPAIEISSRNIGTANSGMGMNNTPRFISTGQVEVGISISGTIGAATSTGISASRPFDLLSAFGDIAITTNGQFNLSSTNARAFGAKASSEVTSSSADVTIVASAILDSTANTDSRISTSGAVKILPHTTNFNADSSLNFDVEAGSFEFGNLATLATSTKGISVNRNVNVSGDLTVSSNTITVAGDLASTGVASQLLLSSNGATTINSSRVISGNGDIILRSGSYTFNATSTINGSGRLTLVVQF